MQSRKRWVKFRCIGTLNPTGSREDRQYYKQELYQHITVLCLFR